MHGMSRSLARDLGPHGIRVNTGPGLGDDRETVDHHCRRRRNQMIDANQAPLKGRVYPIDIARMALGFLAADDSRMITAQDFIVDGGWAPDANARPLKQPSLSQSQTASACSRRGNLWRANDFILPYYCLVIAQFPLN